MAEGKHPTLGNVIHSETEAEARRKREVRRAIELRQEAKEAGIDYRGLL